MNRLRAEISAFGQQSRNIRGRPLDVAFEEFSTELGRLIKRAGFTTNVEIAERAKEEYGDENLITSQNLSKWLGGNVLPKLESFAMLMEVLGTSNWEQARLIRLSIRRRADT